MLDRRGCHSASCACMYTSPISFCRSESARVRLLPGAVCSLRLARTKGTQLRSFLLEPISSWRRNTAAWYLISRARYILTLTDDLPPQSLHRRLDSFKHSFLRQEVTPLVATCHCSGLSTGIRATSAIWHHQCQTAANRRHRSNVLVCHFRHSGAWRSNPFAWRESLRGSVTCSFNSCDLSSKMCTTFSTCLDRQQI
jgi:hypothetical protein